MGDSLGKIRNQLNEYFQSLDKKQKVKIGLGSFFFNIKYIPFYILFY